MKRYTGVAIALHWLSAGCIVAAFGLALTMVDIPGLTPAKLRYYAWHKWLGVTAFALSCARLAWRARHAPPAYPPTMGGAQRLAAGATHAALYLLLLAVPLSGYLYTSAAGVPVVYLGMLPLPMLGGIDPALKPLFKSVHAALNWALLAAVALHLAAALKHALVDRDGIIQRILP